MNMNLYQSTVSGVCALRVWISERVGLRAPSILENFSESGRGQPHSTTCRRYVWAAKSAKRRGVRLPSAAIVWRRWPEEGRTPIRSFRPRKPAKALQFLTLAFLLLAGPAQAKLNVIVTTADLASLAHEVGGSNVEITTLAKPTEDPHFVDAKPSFILKLNRADVLVEGGAELEIGWLPALLDQCRNPKLAAGSPAHVMCNQGIAMLEVPSTLDRSKGDIHAAGNPHYSVDPVNARQAAENIANAFVTQDPKNAEGYKANLKKFTDALDAKLVEWQKTLGPYKGQQIVAYHNSWIYFGNRFGLKIDLFLEPKPGVPPTPTHLAEVIAKMRADKVHVIIVDPYLNRRTAETVASKTDATVVDVSQFPGGVKGTEGGYIPLLDYLVSSLANALGPKK
jgi:zinc/manganese transport system substrate-binding protein